MDNINNIQQELYIVIYVTSRLPTPC